MKFRSSAVGGTSGSIARRNSPLDRPARRCVGQALLLLPNLFLELCQLLFWGSMPAAAACNVAWISSVVTRRPGPPWGCPGRPRLRVGSRFLAAERAAPAVLVLQHPTGLPPPAAPVLPPLLGLQLSICSACCAVFQSEPYPVPFMWPVGRT